MNIHSADAIREFAQSVVQFYTVFFSELNCYSTKLNAALIIKCSPLKSIRGKENVVRIITKNYIQQYNI